MHETAPAPHNDDSPAATTCSRLAASASPSPPPGRVARWLHACVALPRVAIRYPARALAIVVLLLLIGAGSSVAGMWLWASYHRRAGRVALEHYHTAESLPHLQAALSVWPDDPETVLLAARAARRAGVFADADWLLNHYRQLRYTDENFLLERLFVRAQRGEPDSVSARCRTLLKQNHPAAPLIYEALARGYARAYQPHKAEAVVKEWLQREPDNPLALLIRGEIQNLEMRQSDAIESYRAALTADAALDEARLRLCDTLMQLGLTQEAQPHLQYLRQRVPNNLSVQVYLARVQDGQGNTRQAEQMLETVLARQPNFAPALLERGKLALRAGQSLEAEKWLRQAAAAEPSDSQARYQLFLCLEKNGKSDEAQKEQEQFKRLEKDLEDIQTLAAGKLEQTPHNADLHYRIGMISLRAGAAAEGLRWLHRALQENPNHQGAHKALMEHYQRLGDFDRARKHQAKLTAEQTPAKK